MTANLGSDRRAGELAEESMNVRGRPTSISRSRSCFLSAPGMCPLWQCRHNLIHDRDGSRDYLECRKRLMASDTALEFISGNADWAARRVSFVTVSGSAPLAQASARDLRTIDSRWAL